MDHAPALQSALKYAREFSIANEYFAIDISIIALAILESDSPFRDIIGREDLDIMIPQLRQLSETTGKYKSVAQNVPLTIRAELLIRFSGLYAIRSGDPQLDIYHILLALLSCGNDVAPILNKRGWTFETYIIELNKMITPAIEISRLEFDVKPTVTKPFKKWKKFFWSRQYKNRLAAKLEQQAHRLCYFGCYYKCRQVCYCIRDLTGEGSYADYLIFLCLINEKLFETAIQHYDTHNIDRKHTKLGYGMCYKYIGKYEKAIEIMEAITAKDAACYNGLGFTLLDLEQYDEAIRAFDRAILEDDQYAFAYNNKGYALMKQGKLAEAKLWVLHALELDKANAYAYRNLALIAIQEKNKTDANESIEKALRYRYRETFGDDIDQVIAEAGQL